MSSARPAAVPSLDDYASFPTGEVNLCRSLLDLSRLYEGEVLRWLYAGGFTDLRSVHTGVMRSIALGGTRLTDVANRANMTKQAAGQLVKELVSLSYVSLMTLPDDSRVRMVVFTARGMRMVAHLHNVFARIEAEMATIIGNVELDSYRMQTTALMAGFADAMRDVDHTGKR